MRLINMNECTAESVLSRRPPLNSQPSPSTLSRSEIEQVSHRFVALVQELCCNIISELGTQPCFPVPDAVDILTMHGFLELQLLQAIFDLPQLF